MLFRLSDTGDAKALRDIYAQYIHTPVTFEYDLPTLEEFTRRIDEITARYPYIVCEEEGRVIGYAYAHALRERIAYQWDAELSIYLDRAHTARGLGSRLYTALMELLALQGIRTVYGCVTLPNPASEQMHLRLGFDRVGAFHRTGYKNGLWLDVAWFERPLLPASDAPVPPRALREVPCEQVQAVLKNA